MTSRRQMLKWLGLSGASVPLLPSVLGDRAIAQPAAAPKRIVFVYTHNHQTTDYWLPSGGETDFTLSPVLAPFEPFRDRLLVLHNLRSEYHDHIEGHRSALNEADGMHASVDQVIAQRLGNATRIRSLELGVQSSGDSISWSAAGIRVPPMEHPRSAFDRIVNAAVDDPATRERLASQGSRVLSAVAERYGALSSRLTSRETRLLDAHLREITDLETRVADPAMVRACEIPGAPAIAAGSAALRDESMFPQILQAQLDNIVTAFTCDVTRVASLMVSKNGSTARYTWLPEPVNDLAHDVAHGFVNETTADIPDAAAQWTRIQAWHAEQIVYLLNRLDSVAEEDGTLLDHTAVVWLSELGMAENGTHRRSNMPVVIAGGAGGFFRTGRFLDMGERPYGDLLITLAHAMGFEDVTSFGTSGTAPLDVLRA